MKKKILFVIESLHLGGAEKSLVTLLQNLDFSKYEVDLLTFSSGGFFKDFVPEEVRRIVVNPPKIGLYDRLKFALKRKLNNNFHKAQLFWSITGKYYSDFNKSYDVAIAYNQGLSTYFVNQFVQAEKKYAWLNTDYQKAGYNINFDFPLYKNFDKIVAVSPEAKNALEQELKKNRQYFEIEIIKDITDQNMLLKQSEKPMKISFSQDKINIVSIARLVKPKGLNLAVEAGKILIDKGFAIKWYVIGEGSERKNIEQNIKHHQMENHFFLLGADSNPYPYVKNCDIYVQTSLFEGLGLSVIEAALLHKPIVSTNFPTVFGIIENEKTGLIVEMSAEDIAEKIEQLLTDEHLKQRLVNHLSIIENRDKEITLYAVNHLLTAL